VYPGDVEHIEPKSVAPRRVLDWSNLTLACLECNRRKLDYYSAEEPLVHPYEDDPEEHIRFYGPQPVAAPDSPKGLRTIGLLELDRPTLLDRRRDLVQRLTFLLELWVKEPPGLTKTIRRRAIEALTMGDSEYAGMVRWFLRATPEWMED
jgi:hypothetical protein